MTEKYGTYYRIINILSDLAIVNLAGYLAYLITFWPEDVVNINSVSLVHVLLINFLWFNVTQMTRLYQDVFSKDAIPTIKQSMSSLFLFSVLVCCLVYLIPGFSVTNKLIIYMIILFTPLFFSGEGMLFIAQKIP